MPRDSRGNPVHSFSRAKLNDEMHQRSAAPAPKPAHKEMPGGEHAEGQQHPAPSEHSIEDHVAEHGPAHHVEHHHDKATGKHHVTSHHGDGNEPHHSVHNSHEEAHAHMGRAMGVEDDNEEYEEPESEEPEEEYTHGSIPGMG